MQGCLQLGSFIMSNTTASTFAIFPSIPQCLLLSSTLLPHPHLFLASRLYVDVWPLGRWPHSRTVQRIVHSSKRGKNKFLALKLWRKNIFMIIIDHGWSFKSVQRRAFVNVTSKNPTVLSSRSVHREMGWNWNRDRKRTGTENQWAPWYASLRSSYWIWCQALYK